MPIILIGAYRLAKDNKSATLFFIFGCVGGLLLLPFYFDKQQRMLIENHFDALMYTAGAAVFVLTMGVLARLSAMARWRTIDRVDHGRCAVCGYDLRATPGRCPECGTISANEQKTGPKLK